MRTTLLICLTAALAACQKPEPAPEPPRLVRTLTVTALAAEDVLEFSGEVRARHEARLGFRVGGKIIERLVDVGAQVKAGQPLARLDNTDYLLASRAADSRIGAAQSAFDQASANLKRFTTLREKNFISEAELERHRSNFTAARAALDSARSEADITRHQQNYTTLSAEREGVITAIDAEVGQVVAAGQPVMQMARAGEWEVALFIPEDKRAVLQSASAIRVSLWAAPGKSWAARVREISPSADPLTRTYATRLTLTEPAPLQLGMSASVRITTQPADPRPRVPLTALIAQGEGSAVWVLEPKSQTVRRQPVTVGETKNNEVLIASGLAPGQIVVTAGAHQLHEGQSVRAIAAQP